MPHSNKGTQRSTLTLQLDSWPSPPAQTIFSVTKLPHQSGLLQVAWSTMGSRACCRISARGPPAGIIVWIRDLGLMSTPERTKDYPIFKKKLLKSSAHSKDGPSQWHSRGCHQAAPVHSQANRQAWSSQKSVHGSSAWSRQCHFWKN